MLAIRRAAVAGRFYPSSADELSASVDDYLDGVELDSETANAPIPKALIVPHAGYIYSGAVAARAYARIKSGRGIIKRVILLGPCHRVAVKGLALSSLDAFETPLGIVPVDREASLNILPLPQVEVFDATHEQEHSLEVHLPFLQQLLDDFTIVPLVVGAASPEEVSEVIAALWGGKETLIVVSTDLSHFHDYEDARQLDAETCAAIEKFEPEKIPQEGACGRFPVGGLLTLARKKNMTITTLDLRNSGDTAGPKERVVGYGSWILEEPRKSKATIRWNKA